MSSTLCTACLKNSRKWHGLMKTFGNVRYVSYIYDVSLTTGKAFGAGTDANIFIRLIGERGSSDELSIQTKKSELEKGMTNHYQISLDEDIGILKKVIVRHDNTGLGPAWLLNKVNITDNRGRNFKFDCNTWLVKEGATNPIVLLKTDEPKVERTWKKKEQEEYAPDESLEQVALSLVNFDEFFEEIEPQKEQDDDEIMLETNQYEPQIAQSLQDNEIITSDLQHTFVNEIPKVNVRHTTSLSPSVKHLVDTYGLNFFDVDGTGPQGRVLKGDVLAFMVELNITDCRLKGSTNNVKDIDVSHTQKMKPDQPTKTTVKESYEQNFIDHQVSDQLKEQASNNVHRKFHSPHLSMTSKCNIEPFIKFSDSFQESYSDKAFDILFTDLIVKCILKAGIQFESLDVELDIEGQTCKIKSNWSRKTMEDMHQIVVEDTLNDQQTTTPNIGIRISKSDVIQLSSILKPYQILHISYSCGQTSLNPQTLTKIQNGVVCLTMDGNVLPEEIGHTLLGLLKTYLENPTKLLL
ncbi:uncharacterized protein [Clytia hemisphaerica]|uniref:uncharacterized protein n=1 Tax=Clytia hemisphaerica TaxID=252671 RepID=UPI0034D46FDB